MPKEKRKTLLQSRCLSELKKWNDVYQAAGGFLCSSCCSLFRGYYHRSCVPDSRWLAGGSGSRKGDWCQATHNKNKPSDHDVDKYSASSVFVSSMQAWSCTIIFLVIPNTVCMCFVLLKDPPLCPLDDFPKIACFYFVCIITKLPVSFPLSRNLTLGGGTFVPYIVLFLTTTCLLLL